MIVRRLTRLMCVAAGPARTLSLAGGLSQLAGLARLQGSPLVFTAVDEAGTPCGEEAAALATARVR